MEPMYYIGLDVHKRTICYCVKDSRGAIHSEGSLSATRFDLDRWMKTLPQPWGSDGSDHVHRLDLRSPQAPCSRPEGGSPFDAAGHCGREKEERPHRCRQDLRLPAL
jgi:hypothetical protein